MLHVLHISDLHLGWVPRFLRARSSDRQQERDSVLRRIVDWALKPKNDVNIVVIAGDLFETHRPEVPLVEAVLAQISRLDKAGIAVVTVPGNHDEITYHDSVYRRFSSRWPGILVQNPMPAKVASLTIKGTQCHFYSMAYTGGLTRTSPPLCDFPKADEPGIHMGIFHGSLDWDTGDRSLPITKNGLERAGYDYVALGHIHKHIVYKCAKGVLAYSGAIESKTFSDLGSGHLTKASIDEHDGSVILSKPDIAVRKHTILPVDVSTYTFQQELEDHIRASFDPEMLIQILLTGSSSFVVNAEELEQNLAEGFYHVEVKDDTDSYPVDLLQRWASEPTIRGLFVSRLIKQMESCDIEDERVILHRALMKGISAFRKAYEE